jgi:WD40 repeat protein
MTATETPSVIDRTRPIAAGAPVAAVHFLDKSAVFVLGEEALLFADTGEPRRVPVHGGAILATASDGERIITGGDDGKIIATRADGTTSLIAADPKRRWIDHVALAPDGAVAWSAGRSAKVAMRKGAEREFEAPSTVGGLAFAPRGLRLAIAHYHGLTLWFPNAVEATPERLEWKGSHLDLTFSPDGRFVVTAMQEPTLHGWRLADGNNMRMSGYPAKVRSMSWSADGHALVTSGANELVVWPFQGKDGPMGKGPRTFASAARRVAIVACHPKKEVTAVGYEDGLALVVRMADGAEILARRPGGAPVSALGWNQAGTALAFGTEDGEAGIIDLS